MKKEYIAIFLLIIAVILGIIFYFKTRPTITNTLEYSVGCRSEKIDSSVYRLRDNTSLIGAFITFKEVPISQDVRDILSQLNVFLREESWTLDYTLAEIPTDSLCQLAEEDFVKNIFIPLDN